MVRFQDVVTNQVGTALPGAFITVRNSPSGTLASITADNGTTLPNPLTADGSGAYYFNAPVGLYSLEFRLISFEPARKTRVIDLDTDTTALAVGLFVNSATFNIPLGVVLVQTSGYSVIDKGSGVYVYDAAVNSAYVAANPRSSFLYTDGRGFRLSSEQTVINTMFGAANDGSDDSAANLAMAGFLANNASAIRVFSSGAPQGAAIADSNLTIGQLVNIYVTGGVTHMRVANATAAQPAHAFVPEAVTSGQSGLWSRRGVIPNTGSTTFAAALWLSETVPGGFQSTAPATAGNLSQLIGMVLPGFGVEFNPQPEIQL